MQGKILIVDAIATNRIVLKVKLKSAFYEVLQASTQTEALEVIEKEVPDLVISALSLPDGGAGKLCLDLHRSQGADHVPVMAVSGNCSAQERMTTLRAGVRDILHYPLDETLLLGRVRNLIRAHLVTSEWQMRDDTTRALGLAEPEGGFATQGHCMLVSADKAGLQNYAAQLRPLLRMKLTLTGSAEMMRFMPTGPLPDVFVLVLPRESGQAAEALRMVSALRANGATRNAGILVLQSSPDSALSATALDMGADDLMTDGFDAAELCLRLRALVRRGRMAERLRTTVRSGLQAAVFDPLTGLHNRRYAMPHLGRIADHARKSGCPFAVLAADLDHFKSVNDRYGHAAGDAVLVEVAQRLRSCLRSSDMAARIGGEEFLIVMPGTTQVKAQAAALRICEAISRAPVDVPGSPLPVEITISIGMAISDGAEPPRNRVKGSSCVERVLASADRALYAAKGRGRNQVTLGRPAA
ncbi:MAG: diguanylate cyclase [Sulfitobacter sp.]|nr:diguanylate cyclase [Sulfitobacter sp.]